MVFVVDGHAAGRNHFLRFQRIAIHDHVLRRPVGAGNGDLVFPALELGGFNRTCFQAHLDFGDVVRFFHPQVDQVDACIATDHVQVTAGSRDTRNVHGVAGFDDVDDFLAIAIDQRNFAAVTQGDGEDVVDVVVVHFLGRTLGYRNDFLAGLLDIGQRVFRRGRRFLLNVTSHQIHLLVGQLARSPPVRHTGRRTVFDEHFQVIGTVGQGFVGGQRFAGCTLAQHTVAASAAFEIDLFAFFELHLGHRRGFRVDVLVHFFTGQWRSACLVSGFRLGYVFGVFSECRGNRERQCRQHEQPGKSFESLLSHNCSPCYGTC